MRTPTITIFVFSSLILFAYPGARADWVEDGIPVCTASGYQTAIRAASDGAGGIIVVWKDERGFDEDIYAQRVDAGGNVLWTSGGVAICDTTQDQNEPAILSDGAGGAIIVWVDYRSWQYDIYAQRVDAGGNALWTRNGVLVCGDPNRQATPGITTDGAGGAIIGWLDNRNGSYYQTYAQRVNALGTPLWTSNGVQVTTSAYTQYFLQVVSDGYGGAVFVWVMDTGSGEDIYGQRLNGSGIKQFFSEPLCIQSGSQRDLAAIPDGVGGVGSIVVFTDSRNGNGDIYALRTNAFGLSGWGGTGGLAVCTEGSTQEQPALVSDGDGGAFVAWRDTRGGANEYDIYMQRVSGAGTNLWTTGGIAVCTAAGGQSDPRLVTDGAGGAIVVWIDGRRGVNNIFAQRVDENGSVKWTTDGEPVCTADYFQNWHRLVSDGGGGVIAVWEDSRTYVAQDVYAQRIERHGNWGYPAPAIHAVTDVPGDQGGYVEIDWFASRLDPWPEQQISYYSIWRATTQAAASGGDLVLKDSEAIPATASGTVYRIEHSAAGTFFWQQIWSASAHHMEAYSATVPTSHDSTTTAPGPQYYQIIAHTTDPLVYWTSAPDSGYSVDNVAPAPPLALAAARELQDVELEWSPSEEFAADLSHYTVYRSETSGFTPGPGNLLITSPDTMVTDTSAELFKKYYYVVTAWDIHENESGPSNEAMVDVATGIGNRVPAFDRLTLLPNTPNPFGGTTEIRFGLPARSDVVVEVYDIAGRRVLERRLDGMPAGLRAWTFDARDDTGARLASGVYLYRVSAAGVTQTRKLVITR